MATEKVHHSEAKVGMVLAEPITDQQGRIIMGEGARLTPVHVKRLERWGVEELVISTGEETEEAETEAAGEPSVGDAGPQIDEDYMRECAAAFKERFQNVDGDPLMEILKKATFKLVVLAGRGRLPGVRA